MSKDSDDELSRNDEKRLQKFLDCFAYLLAKRWIRDQQQEERQSSSDPKADDAAPSAR